MKYQFPNLLKILVCGFVCLFAVDDTHAQFKDWITPGVGQDWTQAGSWLPIGLPGAVDVARIGNLPIADSPNVILTSEETVNGLQVTNGSSLFINSMGRLNANSSVLVSGSGQFASRLYIQVNNQLALTTQNLTIADGAEFQLTNGAHAIVDQQMIVSATSQFTGRGEVEFLGNSGSVFANDGVVESKAGFGGLVLNQGGDGLIDLDGFSGNGSVIVNDGNSFFGQDQFTINGTQLADSFSGTIGMTTASILEMNLSDGWTADHNSQINIQSTPVNSDGHARILGGHMTLAGTMNLLGQPGGSTDGSDDSVLVESAVTILDSAVFNIEQDNQLQFQGPATVFGGTFHTPSDDVSDGAVKFNGLTTYDGTVNIHGLARQQGDAIIAGATTINADRIDMHGFGNSIWDVNHSLTVNAGRIQVMSDNFFDGTFNVGNGAFAQLSINLDDPEDHWTLTGQMNLSNNLPFQSTKVSGSKMLVAGSLNVTGSDVRVLADTSFLAGSETAFAMADSSLVMRGQTHVESGALFLNDGNLINGLGGHLDTCRRCIPRRCQTHEPGYAGNRKLRRNCECCGV